MRLRNTIITLATTLCLIVTMVGAGLFACVFPPSTTVIATFACQESAQISPFSADLLKTGAEATREYTVGNHDLNQLMLAEAKINVALYDKNKDQSTLTATQASTLRKAVDAKEYGDSPDYLSVNKVLSSLGERYALDSIAISHLDDVFFVVQKAEIALGIIALLALVGCFFLIRFCRHSYAGAAFLCSGLLVLVAFAAAGIWAATDFYTFFNAFHSLFFSQGSWLFSIDSLLICMLPEGFWIGMGALWLVVTVLLSIIAVINGVKFLRKG